MAAIPVSSLDSYRLLHEGAQALSRIEANGVRVDVGYLNTTVDSAKLKIADMQAQLKKDNIFKTWQRAYGDKTNLTSRDQLGSVIFGELGHKCPSGFTVAKGKKRFIADQKAFEEIDIPFVKLYFEMDKIENALDTWLYGIQRGVVDGRIHPSYNLNRVRTFRSSCSDPNFQNIPNRNWEIAQMIRRCYIPDEGDNFGEIDYAQQEVRIAACYNHDSKLIEYIKNPSSDMHLDMAMKLFMLPKDQIEKKTSRDMSKNMFVFPQFYGSYYAMCAKDIWQMMKLKKFTLKDSDITLIEHLKRKGITELGSCDGRPAPGTFEYHVKRVEDYLWSVFKVYKQWKYDWFKLYQSRGWFQMLTGFVVRGIFNIKDVSNWGIQGSAFHCLLESLIQLIKKLNKYKMKTKIIGEIHDSLQSNTPTKEINDFSDLCRQVMVDDLMKKWDWIIVPLDIEVEYSDPDKAWSEKKVWEKSDGDWKPKLKKAA